MATPWVDKVLSTDDSIAGYETEINSLSVAGEWPVKIALAKNEIYYELLAYLKNVGENIKDYTIDELITDYSSISIVSDFLTLSLIYADLAAGEGLESLYQAKYEYYNSKYKAALKNSKALIELTSSGGSITYAIQTGRCTR